MSQSTTVTHQQIAEAVGVSRQLVGFALRGAGNMSAQKRQEILDTAERMGYHQYANREARAMASRRYGKRAKCGIVALAFDATFEGQPLPTMPYFAPLFQGIEAEAVRRGLDLVLCPLRPERPPRIIIEEQVDGFISLMHSYRLEPIFGDKRPTDMPVVFIGDRVTREPSLCSDTRSGIFQTTLHLIELGHRKIAFLGVQDRHSKISPHFEGYKSALRGAAIALDKQLLDCKSTLPALGEGRRAMERLLEKWSGKPPFTAVVAFNDLMAMGAVQALQESGFKVPEDVSVTGFDDVSREYGFTPALTSVTFAREEMGMRAIQMLCQQINDENNDENNVAASGEYSEPQQEFPVQLIIRNSTQKVSRLAAKQSTGVLA